MITTLILAAAACGAPHAQATAALRGLDPVLLCEGEEVPGRDSLAETRGRFSYRFADEGTRDRFRADPERFGIQWGGGCGRMGPLSGVGSPERWAVHEGRIYIFASDGCREGFLEAAERFVVPAPEIPEVTSEGRLAGSAWIERAVQAHGGAEAIEGARAIRLVFEGPRSGWTYRLEQVLAREGELRRHTIWTPPDADARPLDTVRVLAEESFVDEGDAVFPMTSPDQIEDLRRFAHREPLALLWARERDGFLALHRGAGELGGEAVEDVLVLHEGLATTLHLDPATGGVRGISWRGRPNDGVTRDVVETFTEWREVDGVRIPVDRVVTVDGKDSPSIAVAWNTVELLPRAPARAFERSSR